MTQNGKTEFSSPFDDMLAANRKEFDDLYGGPAPKAAQPTAPPTRPSPKSAVPPAAPLRPAPVGAPAGAATQGSVDGIAFSFRP